MTTKAEPPTNGSWWATGVPRTGFTQLAEQEVERMRKSRVSWATVSGIGTLSAELERRKKAKASYAGEDS